MKIPKTVSEVVQDTKESIVQLAKKIDEAIGGKDTGQSNSSKKNRNKPKEYGTSNSTEIVRDKNGNIIKYTTYGSDGKLVKEVRITGKEHGGIPRPNVKEPKYNINPKTGEKFQNGYEVRPAEPSEIPKNIPKEDKDVMFIVQ